MGKRSAKRKPESNGANLGFEANLWLTADMLRNNMDAAEYKHVLLGLIFLKYISDAFEERHQKLLAEVGEGADPEDPDDGAFHRLLDEIIAPGVLTASRTLHTINAFTRQAHA